MYKCDNLRIVWYNTWCLPFVTGKWWGKQSSGLLVMYDPIALQSAGLEAYHAYFEPFDQCCSVDCFSTKGMIKFFIKPDGSGEDNSNKHLQLVFTYTRCKCADNVTILYTNYQAAAHASY